MSRHFAEKRHRWAVERDGRLVGFSDRVKRGEPNTVLWRRRVEAEGYRRIYRIDGRVVKVRVKFEVIE